MDKVEFKLYCKEQLISFDQKIIELLEEDLKNKKGGLGPQYHQNLKNKSRFDQTKSG
jgi:hypothetical protein